MWPTQIVALIITLCVYGCLCLTRTKRATLSRDDNPYDLRAALRVLERERRRLELRAIDAFPQREVRFEQQPVIVDSQDDDPDLLAQAVAQKGDSVFYSADQAKDVKSLLRELEDQNEDEDETDDDNLQTAYDTEMDIDEDKFPYVSEKRAPLKKKAFSGKRLAKKRLDLSAGKRSAQAMKTAFSNLSPEEIHNLLLLEGRLRTKEMSKRQRKAKPMVVEIRSQPDTDVEDASEAEDAVAIPIADEDIKGLLQRQGELDQAEDPYDIDNIDQINGIIQAESTAEDPELEEPADNDIFKSALQDLAALQMPQKEEEDKRAAKKESRARWDPEVPIVLRDVPALTKSRNERKKRKEAAIESEPSISLTSTPSLAEMMAKLWIKHKLEGVEIDYLADALNAATIAQSGDSEEEEGSIPIEINSLKKAVRIENLMKELGNTDADLERDGMLDKLALKYLQQHQLRPEDAGITLSKRTSFDEELEAEVAEARKEREEQEEREREEEEEEEAEEEAASAIAAAARKQQQKEDQELEENEEDLYSNNLLRGDDDDDDRRMPLLYEVPDNKINPIPPLPRQGPTYQNRIPYQLMDMPETSEEEDGEEAEDKEDGEIPLSQDIGLISTEVNEPEEVEESEEPVETEDGEIGLSPEEAQRLGAQTSLRNMLNELDTDDNLRKQETNEEENEETLYYQQEKEKCPILEMSRDCQFADMLNIPLNGRKRDLCNRHEMCYICGSTIGLGASICDRGFLADSIKECNGNLNCIRLADTFLRLMRVTHKFNAMPNSVCNVACVRDYVIGL